MEGESNKNVLHAGMELSKNRQFEKSHLFSSFKPMLLFDTQNISANSIVIVMI